jgi:hypothetical protein
LWLVGLSIHRELFLYAREEEARLRRLGARFRLNVSSSWFSHAVRLAGAEADRESPAVNDDVEAYRGFPGVVSAVVASIAKRLVAVSIPSGTHLILVKTLGISVISMPSFPLTMASASIRDGI